MFIFVIKRFTYLRNEYYSTIILNSVFTYCQTVQGVKNGCEVWLISPAMPAVLLPPGLVKSSEQYGYYWVCVENLVELRHRYQSVGVYHKLFFFFYPHLCHPTLARRTPADIDCRVRGKSRGMHMTMLVDKSIIHDDWVLTMYRKFFAAESCWRVDKRQSTRSFFRDILEYKGYRGALL